MLNKLGDLYTDFNRIDLDALGGYARVTQVRTRGQVGFPEFCAFKLMRHEKDIRVGLRRFKHEFKMLLEITKDNNHPSAVTKIYDSGFAPKEFSEYLKVLQGDAKNRNIQEPGLNIISTGKEIQKFMEVQSTLEKKEPGHWLPYLVVELAPYGDSLKRQIHQQSDSSLPDLTRLPTGSIISMALRLLDVIEYLHKNHRRAYIDWKPEHIYWNGQEQRLKLIDWNVTTNLDDNLGEKENIREDLRLFCGAALYCSLALHDPEDFGTSIGRGSTAKMDTATLTRHRTQHRYRIDNANFHHREFILDNKIKQLVKKGMDSKRGFNSPEELKNALLEYAEQELGFSKTESLSNFRVSKQTYSKHDYLIFADDAFFAAEYEQAVQLYRQVLKLDPDNSRAKERFIMAEQKRMARESGMGLPQDAVKHFRQARSYLGADISLAIESLKEAIKAAKARGMEFPDAEGLLNKLILDEAKKDANLALEKGEWNKALDIINKVFTKDPRDESTKKELDFIRGLLRAQVEFQKKGVFKIIAPLGKLNKMLKRAKEVTDPEIFLLKFIERQLTRIKLIRFGGMIIVFMIGVVYYTILFLGLPITPAILSTTTLTSTSTPKDSPSLPATATIAPTDVSPLTLTATSTVLPEATITQTLIPLPVSVLGYGRLTSNFFPLEEPNGKRVQHLIDGDLYDLMLNRKQFVTVMDSKSDLGGIWYKCKWVFNGAGGEGWILENHIEFVPPPSPTPAPTQTP